MFTKFCKTRVVPRWPSFFLAGILFFTSAYSLQSPPSAQQPDVQPTFPIRAAFYYPWFPEAWTQQGTYPYTNYRPSAGYYNGSDLTVVRNHIAAMRYAGLQAGIASWWGVGTPTDGRMAVLLQAAANTPFRWSVYYEKESLSDPSVSQLTADLTYIRDHYGNDPSFLRIGGKFVVFVYADGQDACGMADRWKQANTVGAYIVLKVFAGYHQCANQPANWHQYAPAVAEDSQAPHSYTISPGFWLKGQGVRLARNLARWQQDVQDMVNSNAQFQLVTTFNEWGEGTSVESAQEWRSTSGYGQYLDALHNATSSQATATPPAIPSPTPGATTTPGTTRTFTATADAYTSADLPTTNYGSATQVRVDTVPVQRSYLKFTVQGLSGTVSNALLRIYANSSSTTGYQVYQIPNTTWTETGVTYNNAPSLGSLLGTQSSFVGGQWTSVDVTALVTGNGTFAMALMGLNNTAVSLASRETNANAPQLVITTR